MGDWLDLCAICLCRCPFGTVTGIVIGALIVPFLTVFHTVATLLTSVVWLPHDLVLTTRALLVAERIGPNLKGLALLLLLPCLAAWPVLSTIGACVFSIFHALFRPMFATVERASEEPCPGCASALPRGVQEAGRACKDTWNWARDFWDFSEHSYFAYLDSFSSARLRPGEVPFDVLILDIPVGIVVLAIGIAIGVTGAAVVGVIDIVPGILRAWHNTWRAYTDKDDLEVRFFFFIPFLIVLALVPVAAVAGFAGSLVSFVFCAVAATATGYRAARGFTAARLSLHGVTYMLADYDRSLGKFAFGSSRGCRVFPCLAGIDDPEDAIDRMEAENRNRGIGPGSTTGPGVGAAALEAESERRDRERMRRQTAREERTVRRVQREQRRAERRARAEARRAARARGEGDAAGSDDLSSSSSSSESLAEASLSSPSSSARERGFTAGNDPEANIVHVGPAAGDGLFASARMIPRVWESFFERCAGVCREALSSEALAPSDVEECEPHVLLGVPGVVQYRAALRSAALASAGDDADPGAPVSSGIVLADGTVVTRGSVPPGSLRRTLFDPMVSARDLIISLRIEKDEDVYLHAALLSGDASARASEILPDIDPARLARLNEIVAVVSSVATEVSRLPTYRRKFGRILTEALVGFTQQSTSNSPLANTIPPSSPRAMERGDLAARRSGRQSVASWFTFAAMNDSS